MGWSFLKQIRFKIRQFWRSGETSGELARVVIFEANSFSKLGIFEDLEKYVGRVGQSGLV